MKISAKAGAAIASALVLLMLFALLLFGVGNIAGSRLPDGLYGWLATHWRAGEPDDCRLCPRHLFVVVCDGGSQSRIRNLERVALLRAEYASDPQAWTKANGGDFPCIAKRNFRLASPSGSYGGPYDEGDPGNRWDLSYRVLRDDAAGQTVEVRYMDSRTNIDDALFRYEVTGDTVKPLESVVRTWGHRAGAVIGSMAVLVLLFLVWGLYFAIDALRRGIAARRRRRTGA